MPFEENEISVNSSGGTELQTRLLTKLIDPELLKHFQIISSRVRNLEEDKIRIVFFHDLPNDPEVQNFRDINYQNNFHHFVFVSDWQYQQYTQVLGIPLTTKCSTIEVGFEPIQVDWEKKKAALNEKVEFVYTSTPQRGLNILIPTFDNFSKKFPDVHLSVFSSFAIYGWPHMDEQFKPLFEQIQNHPKMTYRGFIPHDELIEHLKTAHVFAYPCMWPETSCQIAGSKILTKNGVKNIEDIKIGDQVYTHKGNFKTVYDTFKKFYKGKLIKIKPQSSANSLFFTPEHELYVGNIKGREIVNENWKRSDELDINNHCVLRPKQFVFGNLDSINILDYVDDDYYCLDKNNMIIMKSDGYLNDKFNSISNKIEINNEFAFILGLFAGDGSASLKTNTLCFSHNSEELENAEKIQKYFGEKCKIYNISPNELSTRLYSSIWTKFFYNIIGKRREKKIPEFIWDCSLDIQEEFLKGYFAADGYVTKKGKYSITSISPSLSYGICQILTNLNKFSNVSYYTARGAYTVQWLENPQKKYFYENENYLGAKIKEYETIDYDGFVYNFDVEEDHSYFVENVAVHNCKAMEEAMSAGLVCIHPNVAALPSTSGSLSQMYGFDINPQVHAQIFAQELERGYYFLKNEPKAYDYLGYVKNYADNRFNIIKCKFLWERLLTGLLREYGTVESRKQSEEIFV